jgi:hypothetical protein
VLGVINFIRQAIAVNDAVFGVQRETAEVLHTVSVARLQKM